jgi:Cdc6-like AAA superfamily ATPase
MIWNHQGYFASSLELEHYVKPTNWGDLRQAMDDKHATLIIGQSGTGKTLATEMLFEELWQFGIQTKE